MDGTNRKIHGFRLLTVGCAVLCGGLLAWYFYGARDREQEICKVKQGGFCREVLDRLRDGRLAIPGNNVLVLPEELASASVDGEVYVAVPESDLLLVVFKTWRGKGHNMEGLLFASRPLRPTDMRLDYYGNSSIVIGPVPLVIDEEVDQNWYKVSYRLD